MDEVVSVDLEHRSVTTAGGRVHSGDFLVLATGSQVNFYGIAGLDEHSFPLYSLTDAEKLRSAVLRAFEEADRDPGSAKDGINFVVVGGGPTGVEMAGTLSDLTRGMLRKKFRHASHIPARVFLIERSSSLLSMFAPASQEYAASTLRQRGVQLHLGVAVRDVTPDAVVLSDGVTIASKIVVWAAGVKPVSVRTQPQPRVASSGRVTVQGDLSVEGFPRVYAIGDLANAMGPDGSPLPQLAAVAKQAGQHCGRNIKALLRGEKTGPFDYADRGVLAMVGRNAAVAELGKSHHQLYGAIAFAAWLGIHVALLPAPRAKVDAIVEWAWDYFLGDHAGQLIDR
jgi:NADH dehydrogenase